MDYTVIRYVLCGQITKIKAYSLSPDLVITIYALFLCLVPLKRFRCWLHEVQVTNENQSGYG